MSVGRVYETSKKAVKIPISQIILAPRVPSLLYYYLLCGKY